MNDNTNNKILFFRSSLKETPTSMIEIMFPYLELKGHLKKYLIFRK